MISPFSCLLLFLEIGRIEHFKPTNFASSKVRTSLVPDSPSFCYYLDLPNLTPVMLLQGLICKGLKQRQLLC